MNGLNEEPVGESFVSHLVELRDRLLRSLIAVAVAFGVLALYPGPAAIYDFLAAPLTAALPASTPEIERRRKLANAVADSANPRWVEDVRERKLSLANGRGTVHGRAYALEGWGLSEATAA